MKEVTRIDISSATILRFLLIVAGLLFLFFLRDVLLILLVSIILAAAMDPFADRLQRAKLPRALAVFVVYAVLLAFLVLVVALIVPPVAEQIDQLSDNVPLFLEQSSEKVEAFQALYERYNIEDRLGQFLDIFGDQLGQFSSGSEGQGVLSRALSLFGGFASFLLILVISFYFTVDEGGIKKFLRILSPERHQDYVINIFERIQVKLAKWVQGQLLLAVLMGVIVGLVLWLIGVPYAMVFGLIAGLFELIPVIGPILAAIPAIIVAFFLSPLHGIGVLLFYVVLQQIENHFLVPKIMQKAVGLHPVVVIIAMLIGAKVAGVLGLLLAVPVTTIISVFVRDFFDERMKRDVDVNGK